MRKCFELINSENTTYQYLWDKANSEFREKFVALSDYTKGEKAKNHSSKTFLWEAHNNNKLAQVRRKEIRKGKNLIKYKNNNREKSITWKLVLWKDQWSW